MGIRSALCASLVALGLISSARANVLLENPGLTTNPALLDPTWGMIAPALAGSTTDLPGWTITGVSVDVIHSYWQAPPGAEYSVDLVGTPGFGGISQTIPTVAGDVYTLTYYMSINPDNGPNHEKSIAKSLEIQAIDSLGEIHKFISDAQTSGTRTELDMQWGSQQSFMFTARSSSTTLNIFSVVPANLPQGVSASSLITGPVIGNLDLEFSGGGPTPEPATLSILGVSASALLLKRRRGR